MSSSVRRPGPVGRLVLAMIGLYRGSISPLLAPSCRYAPSCSEYAAEAITRFGLVRGGWLAVRRLLRCHPWHHAGFDPVPTAVRVRTEPAGPCTGHNRLFEGRRRVRSAGELENA